MNFDKLSDQNKNVSHICMTIRLIEKIKTYYLHYKIIQIISWFFDHEQNKKKINEM